MLPLARFCNNLDFSRKKSWRKNLNARKKRSRFRKYAPEAHFFCTQSFFFFFFLIVIALDFKYAKEKKIAGALYLW